MKPMTIARHKFAGELYKFVRAIFYSYLFTVDAKVDFLNA
jgi:hypothetical protein